MTNNDYAYPPVGTTSDNRLNIQPNYPNQPQQPYHPLNTQVVGTLCPVYNKMTANYTKKDIGNITWIWCFALFIFTGVCCWIPFVCDSCKEDQIKCSVCHIKKATI